MDRKLGKEFCQEKNRSVLLKNKCLAQKLIDTFGGSFSKQLGIDLHRGSSREIFQWFLASKLYGARISLEIATRTYQEFIRHQLGNPRRILEAGWDKLVDVLDRGGYVRYDFSTASRLLAICENLMNQFSGDMNRIHEKAGDQADLERSLRELGKGVGPVTIQIFLREMRSIWPKANPPLSESAKMAAKNLGLIGRSKNPLEQLQSWWRSLGNRPADFPDLEASLLRLGLRYCRRRRCSDCPFRNECPSADLRR